MRLKGFFVIVCVVVLARAGDAAAQTSNQPTTSGSGGWMQQAWTDRGYATLNLGFESTSGTLSDSVSFTLYEETGAKTLQQEIDSGSFFDLSVGSRVWRNVSAGIGFHRGSNESEASIAASVPHPVVFNSNRTVTAAAAGLKRTEQAVHLSAGFMIPMNEALSVHVTGGPSFFRVRQELLADLTFTEGASPFTTVNATSVISERADNVVGIHVGVDVTYMFYQSDAYRIGGGFFARYAGASAQITVLENVVDSDVGGLQIGFGGRVRF